ncbi:MAG: restriction endonuclease [Alkalinema sp. CAN_BIN05]|nr:restriction endonuclease [Alkalinema sp. CAN_BIN05]
MEPYKGREVITLSFGESISIFQQIHSEFQGGKNSETTVSQQEESTDETIAPNDTADSEDSSYRKRLLDVMLALPPSGFERLCQRLLRESGFEQVIVSGRSGDGGIDGQGILQVNPFVSFKFLFQCKRYIGTVVVSQVRDFRGAMSGRADKGIILTTGTFTSDAQKEAVRDGVPPIELVHGDKLLDMFEKLELGLTPRKTYGVDLHFFKEFQI